MIDVDPMAGTDAATIARYPSGKAIVCPCGTTRAPMIYRENADEARCVGCGLRVPAMRLAKDASSATLRTALRGAAGRHLQAKGRALLEEGPEPTKPISGAGTKPLASRPRTGEGPHRAVTEPHAEPLDAEAGRPHRAQHTQSVAGSQGPAPGDAASARTHTVTAGSGKSAIPSGSRDLLPPSSATGTEGPPETRRT